MPTSNAAGGDGRAPRLPHHPSGDAGARSRTRSPMPASSAVPAPANATATNISARPRRHGLWRGPERGFRARPPLPASQARLHLFGAAGIYARQYRAGGARPQGGGDEAMRLDVVSVPAEQSLPDYLKSGWMDNVDPASRGGIHRQRFSGGDRDRQGRTMVVPPVRRALRQRRLPLHFRGQEHDRRKSTVRSASRSRPSAA